LPPRRIARKPRTSLACTSQRSQGTAASKSRRSALGGWSLGAYPATPEPGNAREPQSSLDRLRSQVPDSSSQRENLISLFGPNLFHSLDTMVRTKIHEQARQGIERLITERALTPGSKLPTESNLAGLLYVSRTTIRSALNLLEQEGKIERTPGQGRIVRQSHAVE
jgi:Bacterial regulatory proteins, gntR family